MKKLMKAIAFATVMCMLLSVSAFAATGENAVVNDGTIDVTVVATAGTQVALLMVDPEVSDSSLEGLTDSQIIYIDQKASAGSNAITFEDINIGDYTEVDVWVGYDGADGAQFLGKVALESPEITITIVKEEVYTTTDLGTADFGAYGIIANLAFELAQDDTTARLIWALNVDGQKKYSKPQEFAGLSGGVKVAATFHNGSDDGEFTAYDAEQIDVDVIILTQNGVELFSDVEDKE